MNNFLKRAGTALIIAASQITIAFLDYNAVFAFYGIIALLALREYYVLNQAHGVKSQKLVGLFFSAVVFVFIFLIAKQYVPIKYTVLLLAIPLIMLIIELYRKQETPFENVAYTLFGILYITIPFLTLVLLVAPPATVYLYSKNILLGFLVLQWVSDTGAYITGSLLGKTKLFPRISPKKTWEGLLGGIVFSLAFVALLFNLFPELTFFEWLSMALIIIVFGTFGDLIESMYKRSIGVKDSGNFLPGHGGFLDRFDSVLFSAPAVFIFLYLFN